MGLRKRTQHDDGVSFLGATAIGIGGMVGGGIFAVLGIAAEMAGTAAPLTFAVSGVIALLTAYSYAKLSVAFPGAGGTVLYIDKVFGVELGTGLLNNLLWLSYIVTLSLYSVAFANYGGELLSLDGSLAHHLLISGGILLPAVLNVASPALISRTETYVVGVKVTILVLVIVVGLGGVDGARLSPDTWGSVPSLLAASMIMFVAFEGFELIANASSDVRDYKKTLPRAFYASVGIVTVLYILIAIVTVGTLTPEQITSAKDYALAKAAEPSLGNIGFTLVASAAVLSTFSAINATIYGSARLAYTIAEEGELPAYLKRKVWTRPVAGLATTTVFALLMANTVDLTSISTLASAGFLIVFAVVNAATFRASKKVDASRWISGIGVAGCTVAFVALMVHSAQTNPQALLAAGGLLILIAALEMFILHVHRRGAEQ